MHVENGEKLFDQSVELKLVWTVSLTLTASMNRMRMFVPNASGGLASLEGNGLEGHRCA